jgi:V/A-type H+/Na+-transporting ATPase subunit D
VRTAATRWRLLELQRHRRAVETGINLLDRKREGLLRALTARSRQAADSRRRLEADLAAARAMLDRAAVDIGDAAARAAGVAQLPFPDVGVAEEAVVGVRVARLTAPADHYRVQYGPGGTSAALDAAGRMFAALMPEVLRLAQEERAARTLRRGLRRTTRTLNALRAVLLPAVDADIRAVASGLEEEEREEAVRWRAGRV